MKKLVILLCLISAQVFASGHPGGGESLSSQEQPIKKRRRTSRWKTPKGQEILRAAVWELRFLHARIVDTARRYGTPLRTLRRYRDISIAGPSNSNQGVFFNTDAANELPNGIPLPPKKVEKFRPNFTYSKFEESEDTSTTEASSSTQPRKRKSSKEDLSAALEKMNLKDGGAERKRTKEASVRTPETSSGLNLEVIIHTDEESLKQQINNLRK